MADTTANGYVIIGALGARKTPAKASRFHLIAILVHAMAREHEQLVHTDIRCVYSAGAPAPLEASFRLASMYAPFAALSREWQSGQVQYCVCIAWTSSARLLDCWYIAANAVVYSTCNRRSPLLVGFRVEVNTI